MRKIQEPFTLPKHPQLLHEVNEMMIAIKLHHTDLSDSEDPEAVFKARARVSKPTWESVNDLLMRCYKAINNERENPIKY